MKEFFNYEMPLSGGGASGGGGGASGGGGGEATDILIGDVIATYDFETYGNAVGLPEWIRLDDSAKILDKNDYIELWGIYGDGINDLFTIDQITDTSPFPYFGDMYFFMKAL